ncbi:MAG TPA: hypothetical protein VFZ66_15430 [Herpetosiphonaceae bacterium]
MRRSISMNTLGLIAVVIVTFLSTSALLAARDMVHREGDYVTVQSLRERVENSPIIIIGEVQAVGTTVNMARSAEDSTRADPYTFVVGQSYTVAVERYLKGGVPDQEQAPMMLNVLQPEGMLTGSGQPITPTEADIARAKSEYEHSPMQVGGRYMFFLYDLPEMGAHPAYVTGYGYPWRFTLPHTGMAVPESPATEANTAFPRLTSDELITQVQDLIESRQ